MLGRVIKANQKNKYNIPFQNVKKPVVKRFNQVLKVIAKVRVAQNIHQIPKNKKKAVAGTIVIVQLPLPF
jgi:hypothetical protein